ncbi:MAG: oligosaccharide flippase family protein [Bacteroidetes bacterium]|nr:oligosaccharide flippase family protein [Bacteroidota bacterium]
MLKNIPGAGSLISNRSPFIRNTLKLVLGSGIAQVITFLVSPVLTRLYTPEDFGVFTFFISIVGLFALVATLRYELAIIFPKEDKDAFNILSLTVIIAFGLSLVLLILVIVYSLFLSGRFPINPVLSSWLFLLPVLVFLLGLANSFQNWLLRKKQYRFLSAGKIINSLGNNLTALFLGLMGTGIWGLLAGNLTGTFLFVLFLGFCIHRAGIRKDDFDPSSLMRFARKYKDLPTSNSLQAILEAFQNYGIIYLAKVFFSSSVVGFYALSLRILQTPLWLIGSSISQVYMKDAAERYNKQESLEELLMKTIRLSALVATPMLVILLAGGPWLFAFIFGAAWREAGVYAQILAPWMFFDFIRYCIAQTPLVVGRIRPMFYISVFGNGLMIVCFCIGGWVFRDVKTGFLLLSFFMSFYAIGVILWIRTIVKPVQKITG